MGQPLRGEHSQCRLRIIIPARYRSVRTYHTYRTIAVGGVFCIG